MKKQKSRRYTKTFSVTMPPELLPEIKRRAFETHRSVSGYLSWLIARDTRKD